MIHFFLAVSLHLPALWKLRLTLAVAMVMEMELELEVKMGAGDGWWWWRCPSWRTAHCHWPAHSPARATSLSAAAYSLSCARSPWLFLRLLGGTVEGGERGRYVFMFLLIIFYRKFPLALCRSLPLSGALDFSFRFVLFFLSFSLGDFTCLLLLLVLLLCGFFCISQISRFGEYEFMELRKYFWSGK